MIDEQPEPGGQIWRAIERTMSERSENLAFLGPDYAVGAERVSRFRACGTSYWPSAMVWHLAVHEDGNKTLLVAENGVTKQVQARYVLLASGAMERPVPIPGWTLPGVMTIGAAQTVLKSSGLYPQAPLVLAGTGPLLLLLAAQYHAAGIPVSAMLDTTPAGAMTRGLPHLPKALAGWRMLLKGCRLMQTLAASGIPVYRHSEKLEALGEDYVERVRFSSNGRIVELEAATLLLHEGVVPNPQLTRLIGCEHRWVAAQRCFHPVLSDRGETSVPGVFVAGDGGGIGGALAAEHAGRIAALEIAEECGAVSALRAMSRSSRSVLTCVARWQFGLFSMRCTHRRTGSADWVVILRSAVARKSVQARCVALRRTGRRVLIRQKPLCGRGWGRVRAGCVG